MNIKRLNILMKSKYADNSMKLYFLQSLFRVVSYWNFSKGDKSWLTENRDKFEVVEHYSNDIEYCSESLEKWEDLKTLDDFLELKSLLQEWYFTNDIELNMQHSIVNTWLCWR